MEGPYADHILDANDVCSNCHRVVAHDRVDPIRSGLARELDAHLERDKRRTSIEFAPHECPPRSEGVFCECGVEGAHERLWDPDDVGDERFRELVKATVQTLEEKGVDIRRRTLVGQALQAWRHGDDVDAALSAGIDAAIATATSSSSTSATRVGAD